MVVVPSPRVAGLLLAAGAGRRMGGPKALLRHPDGVSWVERSARALLDGGCSPLLVVVGARGDEVAALVPPPALVVTADGWEEGMGASLRAGLGALSPSAGARPDVVAVLVGLVDTPGVTSEVVARLVAVATVAGPASLARASYGGQPGHPVVLGRDHWAGAAAAAAGDAGARTYLAGGDVDVVPCEDVGDGRDVDVR